MAGFPYWDDSRVKVIKYKNLVKNPQIPLQEVGDFIGEKYTQEILKYNEKTRYWYAYNTNARSHKNIGIGRSISHCSMAEISGKGK